MPNFSELPANQILLTRGSLVRYGERIEGYKALPFVKTIASGKNKWRQILNVPKCANLKVNALWRDCMHCTE